ncbi:hypothetical protein MIR68_008516 [Amoeboaphelidium protococcarum]|nr:hypothetical protein MIR68_008516 [Amoeboaphelidium protococcarum]
MINQQQQNQSRQNQEQQLQQQSTINTRNRQFQNQVNMNPSVDSMPTPSRFMMENGLYNFTPGLLTRYAAAEVNPFEQSFNYTQSSGGPVAHPQHQQNQQLLSPNQSAAISHQSSQQQYPQQLQQQQQETGSSGQSLQQHIPTQNHPAPPNATAAAQNIQPQEGMNNNAPNTRSQSLQDSNTERSYSQDAQRHNTRHSSVNSEQFAQSSNESADGDGRASQSLSATPKTKKRKRNKAITDEAKRSEFLERNRLAAYKCRQRKKQWVNELEERCDAAMAENEQLRQTIQSLNDELGRLKQKLYQHKDCTCGIVKKYEAGQYSQLLMDQK